MNIEIFKYNNNEIRTQLINGEPYFVGKDVAEILGYSNPRKALLDHVDFEDKTDGVTIRDAIGRNQNPIFINESGLYSLILSSKLPQAKEFKRWVTSEVLPSIRKHGTYMTEQTLEQALTNPDFLIQLATKLKDEQDKNRQLQGTIEEQKPKVIFADAVNASHTSILVGELAKLIKQNGVDLGQKRLFEWLRNKGYLIKRKGCDWNMPSQKSLDMGLFEIRESTHSNADGSIKICKTPKVTGKGQLYFINKFLRKDYRHVEIG